MAIELKIGAVVFRAQFSTADIFQPNNRAVLIGLENDVVELRRLGEPPHRPYADLKLLPRPDRWLSDRPGSDFSVLLLQGADRVIGGQPTSGHAHRIEP